MSVSNPVILHCAAPGAGAAAVLQPAVVTSGGLQPVTEVAEPADLGKVEEAKGQPGLPVGAGDGKVSRRGI